MAVNGSTLVRIDTNVRLLSMTEIREVREPFDPATQQGSSAMPHKRNPEVAERVAGLNRRISSSPGEELDSSILWLERDISHSSSERYTFPDMFGNLAYASRLTKDVIDGLVVNSDRMLQNLNATYGAIYSPRLLNALLEKGLARTESYELVKNLAQYAMDHKIQLFNIASHNSKINKVLNKQELAELFDPMFYLRNIDVAYKRLGVL